MEIENAKITNVSLTMRDYCSLTFWITVEGAGWGCSLGGFKIASGMLGAKIEDFKAETGNGLVAMMSIMDVIGVEKWEDLEGKYCRVKTEGWGGTIHCIGNILKDKWFDIKEFFQNCKETGGRLKSKWTIEEENGYSVVCDNCGGEMNFATQYCPDCGAIMQNFNYEEG